MQIMPTTSSTSLTEQYFAGQYYQGDAADSFAEELSRQQAARDAVANDESHSVAAALDTTPTVSPLQQAPYNLTSDDGGITYTTDEVMFTQQELQDLERDLRANGAPEETLTELQKLAEQPGGSTLAEVKAAVQNERVYPSLSQSESRTLETLTKKIDPSGKLYGNVLGQLAANDGKGALEALVQGLSALNGEKVSINKDEIAVLGKALGLSDASTDKLLKSFGTGQSLKLNQEQLTTFLAPAFNDFSLENINKDKLATALDATLGELTKKAKERMEQEKSASELSSRKVEQSKTVIEKTVLENVTNTLENARSSQMGNEKISHDSATKEDKSEKSSQTHSDKNTQNAVFKDGEKGNTIQFSDAQKNTDAVRDKNTNSTTESLNEKLHSDATLTHNDLKGDLADGQAQGDNSDPKNTNDAWSQLLQKAEVRTESASATQNSKSVNTPILGIGGLNTSTAQHAKMVAQNQAHANRQLSQQAAAQIEKAMLTAAKDGSKSIELQLHPAELGSLTITLTARNGEVSAMIRSEKTETADMLNKQLEQLRQQLESQGIKIDKLEVQSGTQENASTYDKWDGMQQHNQRQEENARREMLERMKNLGTVRNSGTNTENSTLERNVQSEGYTAGNASQSLYIVA